MNKNRRSFIASAVAGGATMIVARGAAAQAAAPVLAETDPQAVALGYKSDNTKVDKAKFPQHTNQACNGCNFFQGKPADAMAPCQLFAGKQVSAKGWCSAWSKKAG